MPPLMLLWLPRGVFNSLLIWFVVVLCLSIWSVLKEAIYHVWWEREVGRLQKAWTNTMLPQINRQLVSSQSFLLRSSFPLFLICFVFVLLNFYSLFCFLPFQVHLHPLFSPLPTTPFLLCPPFLFNEHNVYLWKEVETCSVWLLTLPSFMTYKRTVDTLVWPLFHAET